MTLGPGLTCTSSSHSSALPRPSGPVLQQLFALFPPGLLFPKLFLLRFAAVSHLPEFYSDFSLLRQFLLPELESLTFDVPSSVPTYEVEQLLGALPAEASGLRHLSITTDNGLSACRFIVPKLPKLNRLAIGGIDVGLTRQNITNIQHSRCLQTLALHLHGPFDTENQLSGNMPLELSALKELYLFSTPLQICTSFLLQVSTPQLSDIHITYFEAAIPAELTAFFESLRTSCQTFASLETISMFDRSPDRWWKPDSHRQLHSHIFRPLLKFRRLSIVDFDDIGKYCLDDAFIEDAAVAWPYLRVLKFATLKHSVGEVTFTAMLSLASRCKLLRTLRLTFDATHFPRLPYSPDGNRELWTTQPTLRELHVGHSKVSAASRFPRFLAVLFPGLAVLSREDMSLDSADGIAWRELRTSWTQLMIYRQMFPDMENTWRADLLQPRP
ncbi:hypothetical protein EV702DRAFT_1277963 [Suillus placidus]|uniref:Uncharacterized protein n=1 Tax=Suillus placidus TaxID=48579 RepID=A0A9P7D3X7_9AGAM|nr:hypothetical protein EV702DRAFT_1277963 [Suillus placidus]